MFLIVGLGNIGIEYEHTRHNIGFDAVDLLSSKYNIVLSKKKFKGTCGEGIIENNKVVLLKPDTYMNLSGESVVEAVNFYKIMGNNIIIIHDDIDIPVGRLRIKTHGSAGGHNGVKNIIFNLATDQFVRVKIGIGQPEGQLISHVLGRFSKNDKIYMEKVLKVSREAVECILKNGVEEAMNRFNGLLL
ncbi:aminoacyl-tRNA hydrolase [Clostridium sp. MT-14]|jgi:PTH1 family peptidyl-tRNA hydrolase|uniref:Peptidyl-tRNA hydrolase n=1 Tax=Clostridium aromativorans TaxID=2836848 RepID=A0ABS8N412_9CLOT|nr:MULTISPECIES: aminoacyl-tRNA hydrolase [Clostridium]KAA8672968.1 aminoacyl-tRNA hydrolase [Clostridium sp. HV4-5-A1G]MCC9294534.1 aminoacyl-tRNA hydrolase [Clostridium aromativorans]CAB1254718.1 peptidyl-tRNA hydrolase [Clostridiaceae bacterium BL-3]